MTISPRGVWLAVRPRLGRLRRKYRYLRARISVAGRPVTRAPRPLHPVRARAEFWLAAVSEVTGVGWAGALYERAIHDDGRFPEWSYRLGTVRRRQGDWPTAAAAYRTTLELNDGDVRAHFWLCICVQHLDIDHVALATHSAALRATRTPNWADGRRLTRRRFLDWTQAADTYRTLIAQPSSDPHERLWIGVALHHLGEVELALDHYEFAVAHHSDASLCLSLLGLARRQTGDWRGASEAFQQAVAECDLPHETMIEPGTPDDQLLVVTPSWISQLDWRRRRLEDWKAIPLLLTSLETPNPNVQYWRGVVHSHLKDWDVALQSLRAAVRSDPTNLRWNLRLAASLKSAACWEESAAYFRAAIDIENHNVPAHVGLGTALQRLEAWPEAAEAFERAIQLAGPRPDWIQRLSESHRKLEDWQGLAALHRAALERKAPGASRHFFWLGLALQKLADWPASVVALRRSAELQPTSAETHFRLGLALEKCGEKSVSVDPRVGLTHAGDSDWDGAAAAYRLAVQYDPGEFRYWSRLAFALRQTGELEESLAASRRTCELAPNDFHAWYQTGHAIAIIANRRGAYTVDEHSELESVWGRTLEIYPGHVGARQHLIRSYIKRAKWPDASRLGWYPPPPLGPSSTFGGLRRWMEEYQPHASTVALSTALRQDMQTLKEVPHEWWFALHWCLITDRHFSLGYRAKELMAEQVVDRRSQLAPENLGRHLELARALNHLGRTAEAIEHLERTDRSHFSPRESLALDKLAADIALRAGFSGPHVRMLEVHGDTNSLEAERRFGDLIRAKRVAVVGPAETDLQSGQEIDDFDVIIRTKFIAGSLDEHAHKAGSRTDVSYYALGSAQVLKRDILGALDDGHLQMAVFRTATFDPRSAESQQNSRVRHMPSEYLGNYRAGQFAIQRILYDVIRYQPSTIKVFNMNFFLGSVGYREGYALDLSQMYSSQGLTTILSGFGHDYLSDFLFTKQLHDAQRIEVDNEIAKLLSMTGDEYLLAMDAKPHEATRD